MNKCIEDLGMLAYSTGHTLQSMTEERGLYCTGCKYYFRKLFSIHQGQWRCPNCLEGIIKEKMRS